MNYTKEITIDEETRQELRQSIKKWFESKGNGNNELKQAEKRLIKLRRMEQNLQRLILEDEISLDDFKEHRRHIEAERTRVQNIVDTIGQKENLVKADFEVALHLATELDFLFEKGNFDEKRLLCETLFKRVYLKEGKISDVELNAPFSLIVTRGKGWGTVKTGSPNGKKDRTFQATFEIPFVRCKAKKFRKREYRNPICLVKEWRKSLDNGEYESPAALARHHKVSRARVTQILNLFKLSPEVIEMFSSIGDPLTGNIVTERKLRSLLTLDPDQQVTEAEKILSRIQKLH